MISSCSDSGKRRAAETCVSIALNVNGARHERRGGSRNAAALRAAQRPQAEGHALRLRHRAVRRVHRDRRRQSGAVVRRAGVAPSPARRSRRSRASAANGEPASAAAGVHRRAGGAVRLLRERHHHGAKALLDANPRAERRGDTRRAQGQSVPLRHAHRILRAIRRARRAARRAR